MWRGIFGPKRGEVTGEWRKLHNEELHHLYYSPTIVRVIKSRRMRWAEHLARMWRERRVQGFFLWKPGDTEHWENPGLDGRIILR
jgi:hypothetical protein